MNASAVWGWGLSVVAVAVGYASYGWPGVVLAITVVVFWLLLQFSRVMRAMRLAGQRPVGQVPSAVMLHAKLEKGLRLIDIIQLTRSLGDKLAESPETYAWRDESGARVVVRLADGRCTDWSLTRPDLSDAAADPGP